MAASTKKGSTGKKVAIGAGLAAITAAGIGAYLLTGSKNAARNRKQAKAWAIKARAEIGKRLENLPEMNEATYNAVVKEVSNRYKKLKYLDTSEMIAFANELKGYWRHFAREMQKAKGASRRAKPSAKKASKK